MIGTLKRMTFIAASALVLLGCAAADRKANQSKAISNALAEAAFGAQRQFEYKAAAGHYKKLYQRRPEDIQALIGMARNLRYSGSVKEAIVVIREGIREHGEKPELLLEMGKALLANSSISAARETLEKARQLDPGNWQVYSTIAIVYDRTNKLKEAQELYRKALELSPGNVSVLNNLALSLAQAGKLDQGIAILEKVTAGADSTVQVRQNLALLYGLKGDMAKAEKLIREDLPPDLAAENIAALKSLKFK